MAEDEELEEQAERESHVEYTVDATLLWDMLVVMLTFDEFIANRIHALRREPKPNMDAVLHLAQNKIIIMHVTEKVQRILRSQVTEEEKRRLEEYMKRMKRDNP